MIRAVIFDFNGVLVDDEQVHFELFREVLADSGIALSEAVYHERYLGFDDRGCFEAALADAGKEVSWSVISDLIDRKARRYLDVAGPNLRFFPGAAEALVSLAGRWPVAICSGALRGEIQLALGLMGVADRVHAIVSAEDTTRCKPDPEGYLLALDALRSQEGEDLEAAHCLVVEDSLAGVQAAKAAGMWAIAVDHTYQEGELREAGADAVLAGLTPLSPDWVEHFFAPEVSP